MNRWDINGWTSVRYWLRCMSSTESLFLSGTQAESRDSVNDIWAILTRGVGQVSAASLCWIQTSWCPNGDNWNTHVPPQTHKGGGDSLQLYTRCVRVSFLIFPPNAVVSKDQIFVSSSDLCGWLPASSTQTISLHHVGRQWSQPWQVMPFYEQ